MLTVTKEGQKTGDYWAGIREVEKARAVKGLELIEQRQVADYVEAKIAERRWRKVLAKKAVKRAKEEAAAAKAAEKKKRGPRQNTLYHKWGETIERLYLDGWRRKDIAEYCKISLGSVKLILQRKAKEG